MKSILSYGGVLFLTIYVDQMFFENLIMNYIILYATSKFLGKQETWYRLIIGAVIGALYVILSYIFLFYNRPFICIKVLLAVSMILTSFKIKNIKEFFKLFITFIGITFLIGGASFGLAFLANVSTVEEGGILYVEEFPIQMIALGTVVSITIGKWLFVILKNKVNLKKLLYNIEISFFDKKLSTIAFLDSGNNAREAFTGYPIIIVEKNILKEIIPYEIIDKIEKNNFEFDEKWRRRLRILPISTVNSKSDTLIGFKADEGIIHIEEGNKHIKNVIVAGCDRKLDCEGKYFALIGNILED